jgi:hypothetical protein
MMEDQPKPITYTCGNCFHWERKEETRPVLGQDAPGVCWGAPPSVRMILDRQGNPLGQQNMRAMTRENERACGAFMPAEAGAALLTPGPPLDG